MITLFTSSGKSDQKLRRAYGVLWFFVFTFIMKTFKYIQNSRLWGRTESDTTERIDFHFSLSCFGEGNGDPLQCSCLENPRDGGAWWAAVYGVAQSRTRL